MSMTSEASQVIHHIWVDAVIHDWTISSVHVYIDVPRYARYDRTVVPLGLHSLAMSGLRLLHLVIMGFPTIYKAKTSN